MTELNSGKEGRIAWIDLLRCLAICCVVLVHSANAVYPFDLEAMTPVRLSTVFAYTLLTVGRLGVPVFLMITGYLLLDRPYGREQTVRFWKKNLLSLLLTVEIWIVVYDLFLCWFYGDEFSLSSLLADMLFLQEVEISHFWYMPVILGIYLFLPLVATALQHISLKTLAVPLVISGCFLFGVPTVNVFLNTLGLEPLSSQLSLDFSGGIYGILVIIGYLFKKDAFKKIRKGWFAAALAGGLLGTIAMQVWAASSGYLYNVWYSNPLLCLASWGLFGLLQGEDRIRFPGAVRHLGTCSFGIYLLHVPILRIFDRYLTIPHRSLEVLVLFLLSLGISWILVELVSRIPGAGRILFYIRTPLKEKKKE